jgi:hypothetical protein
MTRRRPHSSPTGEWKVKRGRLGRLRTGGIPPRPSRAQRNRLDVTGRQKYDTSLRPTRMATSPKGGAVARRLPLPDTATRLSRHRDRSGSHRQPRRWRRTLRPGQLPSILRQLQQHQSKQGTSPTTPHTQHPIPALVTARNRTARPLLLATLFRRSLIVEDNSTVCAVRDLCTLRANHCCCRK